MVSIKSEKNVIWAPFRQNSCIFTKKTDVYVCRLAIFVYFCRHQTYMTFFFIYYMDSTTEKGKRQDIEGKQPSAQTGTHHASSHHRSHSPDGSHHHHHHHHKKDESERMKDRILLNAKRRKLLEKVLLYVVSILAVIMVVICFIAYYFNIQ